MSLPPKTLQSLLKLAPSTELFTTITELLPQIAVYVVDQNRDIIFWNQGAQTLLGYSPSDVLGQHCRKISRCQECMIGCPLAEQGSLQQQPLTLYNREGTSLHFLKTAKAILDKDGLFVGGIELLTPTTQNADILVEKMKEEEDVEYLGEMVTRTGKMREVFRAIRNISETDATVFIHGESGTGKELVARAIHQHSLRKKGPFIAINCAALTPSLLESELFGHEKGAFTGAVKKRMGLFQQADGGTIFLDEVAELPIDLQSKLLRVLEEREVIPVGTTKPIKVNIRILSATHKSLRKQTREGYFREDLMYRLRVVPLRLPPLRERPADIELLVWHFIQRFNEFGPRKISTVAPEAMRIFFEYPWPGNARELKNAIEYAFAVGRGTALLLSELPLELLESEVMEKLPETNMLTQHPHPISEKERLIHALERTNGNIGKTAELLGLSRPTLWRKRKKYDL